MDDAWTVGVAGKASLEKNKYTELKVYSVADTCTSNGSGCVDGDKVFADRKTQTDAYPTLTTKITDYESARTTYVGEYDK